MITNGEKMVNLMKRLDNSFSKKLQINEDFNEGGNTDVRQFNMFSLNYPYDFIEKVWEDKPNLINHLKGKFDMYYDKYGSNGVMLQFWVNLDNENRLRLENWIKNNYRG